MSGERLVHEGDMEFQGVRYEIRVFCADDGRHYAKTRFSDDDIIINDGPTLNDVLSKHASLLPLAVHSRKLLRRTFSVSKRRGSRF
jgi:hypothetical protein